MEPVSRYGKLTAKPGKGDELAAILLKAADDLADDPGCLLYMVNRQKDAPDTIWVTELWRSQDELDVVLARIRGGEQTTATMALVEGGEMVELELLGGKGAHTA
ncbi:MAG TPA: antibiotic biosynthesis monooxygenase family protein [Streptosporangiaceae bacterium]|jgi:quinol monooxygenase YgiN